MSTVEIVPAVGASLTVLMGTSPPTVTGDGGWSVVNRPKKVGFTSWEGYSPRTMSLKIMFDGFIDNASQDLRYAYLHKIMRNPTSASRHPAPVRIKGAAVPFETLVWVIQGIEEDSTTILRGDSGELLRIEVTLSLLEYIQADVLVSNVTSPVAKAVAGGALAGAAAGSAATGGALAGAVAAGATTAAPSGRSHTVKVGDTLWGIATKYLGAGKRYTEIAALNGIKDPNRVPVGTVLKIP